MLKSKKMVMVFLLAGSALAVAPARHLLTSFSVTSHSPESPEEKRAKPTLTELGDSSAFADIVVLESGKVLGLGYNGHDPTRLYFSQDRGSTWHSLSVPTEGFTMRAATFVDGNAGWIVGASGLVLFTRDSGDTWQKLGRPTYYELSKVSFVNKLIGYAASNAERGCQIFRTQDGGKSWQKMYEDLESGYVFDLAALDAKVVIAAINGERLLRSEDGGLTWRVVNSSLKGASGVVFTRRGVGWVVGEKGSFYLSSDQGRTWQRPPNTSALTINDWQSISFRATRGVAVGARGALAVTDDDGSTWSVVDTGISERFDKVRLDAEIGFILGSQKLYKIDFASK